MSKIMQKSFENHKFDQAGSFRLAQRVQKHPTHPSGGIFHARVYVFFPTTFMLRVTFSPAPECVEVDCWNQAFQTPRATRTALLLL